MPIKVDHISITYQPHTPFAQTALKNISTFIEDGSVLGIMGAAGSGKSTLLQILTGLLVPDQGKVVIDNEEVNLAKGKKLHLPQLKVGLVMQFPERQLFQLTVASDIAFGPQNLGFNRDEVQQRVEWAMDMVNLPYQKYGKRPPHQLSSGEKRLAAIAGILALKPQYLLLDEPTAGLDAPGRNQLLDCLRRLNQDYNTTLVIVSHQLSELLEVGTHLLILVEGEVFKQGDIWTVLNDREALIEQGFDLPVAGEVINRLNQRGWDLDTRVRNNCAASRAIARALRK
ncbi:MAG: ATP-binding cassette domain-containing protein [Syntrophomonadaceae bacterium]|jgi:energy-coupling factor transport system ATP-binding protein